MSPPNPFSSCQQNRSHHHRKKNHHDALTGNTMLVQFHSLTWLLLTLLLSTSAIAADSAVSSGDSSLKPRPTASVARRESDIIADANFPTTLVKCETSGTSPRIESIRAVVDFLYTRSGTDCCNWNRGGSKCSKQYSSQDAAISLCGPQGCLPCEDIATSAMSVVKHCAWRGRAGGIAHYDRYRIPVF